MATFYTDVTLWRQMGRPHSHTRPRHEPGQLHPQGEQRDSKNGGPAGEKRRGHGKELVGEEERRRDSEKSKMLPSVPVRYQQNAYLGH